MLSESQKSTLAEACGLYEECGRPKAFTNYYLNGGVICNIADWLPDTNPVHIHMVKDALMDWWLNNTDAHFSSRAKVYNHLFNQFAAKAMDAHRKNEQFDSGQAVCDAMLEALGDKEVEG